MKIFNVEQIKELEKQTLRNQYISNYKLIDRAASKLVEALQKRHKLYHSNFVFLCGSGNNGADALALAALVKEAGGFVKVYLLQSKKYTAENNTYQDLLMDKGVKIEKFTQGKNTINIKSTDIVIDGLFGIGLKEPLEDSYNSLFEKIKASNPFDTISIDMPSGLFCDKATAIGSPVFAANMVYTFETAKLALLLPLSSSYAKGFEILDIQLDQQAKNDLVTTNFYIRKNWVKQHIKIPNKFTHKGQLGHGLLIGGSYSKIGAVALSSKAALKTGCGLVSAYVPMIGYSILQSSLWEVMCLCDSSEKYLSVFPDISDYKAVGVGMGMGMQEQTIKGFLSFLKSSSNSKTALVLDADAINILALHSNTHMQYLPKDTILTPHPKELERLIGPWEDDFSKIQKVKDLAKKYQVIIIVKGAHSEIVLPSGHVYFNSTGNWSLATAGAGDVLTGMIVGLLAQGYSSELAAILGVYLHGKAGDMCILSQSGFSVTASDVICAISNAYLDVLQNR